MKVISVKKEQIMCVFYILVIAWSVSNTFYSELVPAFAMPAAKKVVILDAGHGGWDPGKVGAGEVLEKDINLTIAKKLQAYLEQGGATVIVTREEDDALGSTKASDMWGRKKIANEAQADILVSVHQNAFSSESVKGAQVFYFDNSEKSQKLAASVQKELKAFLSQRGSLEAKSNDNYYILKQTTVPAVIVECGFLTNPAEKQKLTQDEYQEKVAWGIYMGIIQYFQSEE